MGDLKCIVWVSVLISFNLLSETAALKNTTNVRVRSFHCINGNYIFSSWFCDTINDCGDASDESYGCDSAKCGVGNFTCENSQCLPISVRCNGAKECSDGSDEKFCDHEPDFDDCEITKGKFLCKDKFRCIDLSHVCDEEVHCFDGSDEGNKCDEYDPDICNTCYHACYRTPVGPYCFYNQTTERHDEVSNDISSCAAEKNFCDQKCVSFKDTNQCSCEENFVPSYTIFQAFYCDEKNKSKNMLIYTTKGAIRGIAGYSNHSILIKELQENITAISAADEYVYWGGLYGGYKVIGKTSFDGKDTKIIVSKGIEDVAAMDVDWRTGNVYFIDNIRKHLAACSKDGKRCVVVHEWERHTATAIALSPRTGYMFWSIQDYEEGFIIRKSEMNGQNNYNFIDSGIRDVSSLTADEAAEKLYWLDAVRRKIEMVRFDGSGRKVFKSDLRMNYFSLTVNARYIYWAVKNNGTIYMSPQSRVQPKIALNGTDPVHLLYGYSYSEKTTKMERPCSWGCDGICLMHSLYFNKTGSDCVCDNVTQVNSDHIWCIENSESLFSDHYEDFYSHNIREIPFRPLKMIVVFITLIAVTSGAIFYLYRKGSFSNLGMFRHNRM